MRLRRLACLALLTALSLAPAARAQAPANPAPPTEPVIVMILPAGQNTYSANVVFPGVVDRPAATSAMDTLARLSGWQVGGVEWQDAPAQGSIPGQTIVSFQVNTLFPNGEFPVEAFAVAFRAWRAIRVAFHHGGAFVYRGQPRYEDANALVEVTPGENVLNLRYEIRNPNLEGLEIAPNIGLRQEAPPAQPARPRGGWIAVAVGGAFLAWLIVFALMGGLRRKPSRKA